MVMSRDKYFVFKKWWMGAFDKNDCFVGFVTTDSFPHTNNLKVRKLIVQELRAKAESMGYKVKGVVGFG
jgi:hypothetical protein